MSAGPATWDEAWKSAKALAPALGDHVRRQTHRYRGEDWTVLEDTASGRHHRLGPGASAVIEQMDGERSLAEIREALVAELGDGAPSPADLVRLATQLKLAGLLRAGLGTRPAPIRPTRSISSPLALRIPLWDPTPVLERGMPWLRPLFSKAGAWVWGASVASALVLAAMQAPELFDHARQRALAPGNLLLLWILFPAVKVLHEFGHAFAVRAWGGAVGEMGITLLVLTPVPYVDASAANGFPAKHRRMLVGAAGVMAELWLAAGALWLWVAVEPGLLRDGLLDVMLIATVSTLAFNGNPLLRFDAYYVLADAAEIPNLGSRSLRYLAYLVERHVFGVCEASSPVTAAGESAWLLVYGIASSVYKLFITFLIAFFLASHFFFLGVLLACWALWAQVIGPVGRFLRFLARDPRLVGRRQRALACSALALLLGLGFLFVVPAPSSTLAEGIVRLPEKATVRAGDDAFVVRLLADEGSHVREGDPLFEMRDLALQAEVPAHAWKLRELEVRRISALLEDRVEAGILQEEIEEVRTALAVARERVAGLLIRSPSEGGFVVPAAQHLPGRLASRGEVLGYVIHPGDLTVRVVVPQAQIDRIRGSTRAVEVRPAQRGSAAIPGTLGHQVPFAHVELPSEALGSGAGGAVGVDVRDTSGTTARDPVFELDVHLPADAMQAPFAGSRVYVRFRHPPEPPGWRWVRDLRRLFLARLQV